MNRTELETKVQEMYQQVALHPEGEFHFEMGRALAERLGYSPADLDRIPRDVTVPPPSPDILTRRCLQKAGYTLEDLDAAAPLLRESEANGAWRKQVIGTGF